MKHKLELFQGVVLLRDLPDAGLTKGASGVVMELLPPDGVAVEFFADDDRTLDVLLLSESLFRPETKSEISARLAKLPSTPKS
jgi:hypothetical protein